MIKQTLLFLAVAAAGLALAATLTTKAAPAAGDACTPDAAWPAARADLASQVLSLVNEHRRSLSLPALGTSPTLQSSAEWKARHMAAFDYMAHDDPAPPIARTWAERIAACGYGGPAGENIARWYPSAHAVVSAWLSDTAHKANIEGPWAVTGIGAATSASGIVYWVEDFGVVGAAGTPPTTATPPPPRTTTATPPPTTTSAAPVRTSRPPICVVPAVDGRSVASARRRVQRAGCALHIRPVATRAERRGRVAWQSPRAGVHMPRGAVVTLAVSAGPRRP